MAYSHVKSKNPTRPIGYKPKDTKLTPVFREFRICTDPKKKKKLRDELALANYPLACKVAKRFRAQWSLESIPIEDMIQTAMIGILKAIDVYDPDIAAFSGFGGLHALDMCQRMALEEGHDVSAPAKSEVLKRLKEFRLLQGREPTAQELGVDEATHEAIYKPKVEVGRLDGAHMHDINDTGGYDQDDNLPSKEMDPETIVTIAELLGQLSDDDSDLYEMRYLYGMSSRQIAKELGIKFKEVEARLEALEKRLRDGLSS